MQCSKQEKLELFPFIDQLLRLSDITRQYGVLALEEEMHTASDVLLKKGLALMIDGTEPEIIRTILLNYSLYGNRQGKELLKGMMIVEGVLSIQQGSHPTLLKEILLSFLGAEMMQEIEAYFYSKVEKNFFIKSYLDQLSEERKDKATSSILASPIEKINERCLQRLLREIDYEILAVAISEEVKGIQEKVLANLSPRLAVVVIEKIKSMKDVTSAEILEAQKAITEVIKNLVKQGEIFI